MRPSQADNPFMVEGWMYIVVIEFVAFMHMLIIYSFFMIFYAFKNKLNIKERLA